MVKHSKIWMITFSGGVMILYNFRFSQTNDLAQIYEINTTLGLYGWENATFHDTINSGAYCIVVENNLHEIIGYVVFAINFGEATILNLTIVDHYRNKGLGSNLLRVVVDQIYQMNVRYTYLHVRIDNYYAIRLYETLGFQTLIIKENYYSHLSSNHAYLMQLDLHQVVECFNEKAA